MSIVRGARKDTYYILPTTVINDDRLSWEARGMLVYLLSKPDHWKVRIGDLIARTKNCLGKRSGRDKVYSLLSELQKAGYVVRQFEREGGSFASVTYEVRDEPDLEAGAAYIASLEKGPASPLTDLPETVASHTESPDTASPFTAKPDAIDSSETASMLEKAVNTFAEAPADELLPDIVSLSDDQHQALAEAPKNYPRDPIKPVCLTWLAYATAFKTRYGQWPIYNAPTGTQVSKVVTRLGQEEAQLAARYYVEHVDTPALTDSHHPISSLLRACESYAVKARAHQQRQDKRPAKSAKDKPQAAVPAPTVMASRKPPITDIAKQARAQIGATLGGKLKSQMTA